MKLKVLDIPEEGMELEATAASAASAASDGWFRAIVVEVFQGDYSKGSVARLDLHLLRTEENVQISGTVRVDLHHACAHCIEGFDRHQEVELQVNMAPEKEIHIEGDDEVVLNTEDLNFSFYKGDEIDLAVILRELLALEIPIRYVCDETCKGLCSRCGQNLNVTACTCTPIKGDSRFAILKQLKK